MSRIATGDRIIVRPTNNVYTILAIIAVLVNVICFVLILMRYSAVFGDKANLFQH
jgi:hypothetical protein